MDNTNNTPYQTYTAEEALHIAENAYKLMQSLTNYLYASECDWLHDIGRAFRFLYTFPLNLTICSLRVVINGNCAEYKAGSLAFPAAVDAAKASEILLEMDVLQKKE